MIDSVVNWDETSIESHLGRKKMPKVNFGIASYNSRNVLIIVVEITVLFLPLKQLPSIFVLGVFLGPVRYLNNLVKAHYHVNDDVFVVEAKLTALDDCFAHVEVAECSAIDELLFLNDHWRKDYWDAR